MAAAGIDSSNVQPGQVALLPADPDASARRLRAALVERTRRNVGVIVTDTAGRAWRHGQTDIAIGAAGVVVVESFDGLDDGYGNLLEATAPAVADELAAAAELAQGKLNRRPFAILRGRPDLVLPRGEHGSGARVIIRDEAEDWFGYGAREAVLHALSGRPDDRPGFGAAASAATVAAACRELLDPRAVVSTGSSGLVIRAPVQVARAIAIAHGWTAARADKSGHVVLKP
jgi:coenzyme F420-0:L-glutamate ligase / coenzyme F420-1:gamma-L-glutamate ligase